MTAKIFFKGIEKVGICFVRDKKGLESQSGDRHFFLSRREQGGDVQIALEKLEIQKSWSLILAKIDRVWKLFRKFTASKHDRFSPKWYLKIFGFPVRPPQFVRPHFELAFLLTSSEFSQNSQGLNMIEVGQEKPFRFPGHRPIHFLVLKPTKAASFFASVLPNKNARVKLEIRKSWDIL